MIPPCLPCITLKRGVQIVAIIHLVLAVIFGFLDYLELASVLSDPSTIPIDFNYSSFNSTGSSNSTSENPVTNTVSEDVIGSFMIGVVKYVFLLPLWIIWKGVSIVFAMVCFFALGCTLWAGASMECRQTLNVWWWISFIILTPTIPAIILSFVDGVAKLDVLDGIGIIFSLYSLWLVNVFIKQISKDKKIHEPSAEDETQCKESPKLSLQIV